MSIPQTSQAKPPATIKNLLANDSIQSRFREILGQKAPGFISSILNIVNNSKHLTAAEPNSVIMAAAVAATLDLPINGNLGFAHIVPYKSGNTYVAQFQMGWKGYVQLAMRTGQYKTISACEIYAGQLKSANPLTGYEFDFTKPSTGEIIGYAAYFKLLTGYEKTEYWNVGKILDHGKKYSKSFSSGNWTSDFDGMAKKTMVKQLLSKWGILSIEMQKAIQLDDAVVREGNEPNEFLANYVDNPNHKTEDQAAEVISSTPESNEQTSNIPTANEL